MFGDVFGDVFGDIFEKQFIGLRSMKMIDQKYRFVQNQLVDYDTGTLKGTGKIVGCVTMDMLAIGRMYVVQDPSVVSDEYPFECFAVPEIMLSPVKRS